MFVNYITTFNVFLTVGYGLKTLKPTYLERSQKNLSHSCGKELASTKFLILASEHILITERKAGLFSKTPNPTFWQL